MRKGIAIPVFLLVILGVFSHAAVDVSGEWSLTLQTQRGEATQNMTIEQDGESLKVTMEGQRGGPFTGEGSIKDNQIEWSITRSTPRGEFTVNYTGTVEGNTMSGNAKIMSRNLTWTAERASH